MAYKHKQKKRDAERRWRAANTEKRQQQNRDAMRRFRAKNPEEERCRARELYAVNRKNINLRKSDWRAKNLDKERARGRRRYENNSEKERAAARERYASDPTKGREINRRSYNKDPERTKDQNWQKRTKRRARKAGAPGSFTASDWRALVARSKVCYWCHRPWKICGRPTHDHVISLSKGGANSPENSVCACSLCNTRKYNGRFDPISGQGILL